MALLYARVYAARWLCWREIRPYKRFITLTKEFTAVSYVRKTFITLSTGFLCEPDLVGIRDWSFNLTVDEASELTDSGKLEHRQLGQRFRQRLPSLIGLFSNESYQVLSMPKGCGCLIEGKLLCSGTVW